MADWTTASSSLRACTLLTGIVLAGCNQEPGATRPAAPATPATPVAPVAPVVPVAPVAPVAPAAPAAPDTPAAPVADIAKPAEPACPPKFPADGPLGERLDLARQQCGALLLVAREAGISALTSDLVPVAELTGTPGRYLRTHLAGDARQLYYFAANSPDFKRLDLRTGNESQVATLPPLRHRCFGEGEPVSPVEYIQADENIGLDVEKGVLCIDIGDRNANMESAGFNYRVDLATKKVQRVMTFVGEDCKQPRDRQEEALCQPSEVAPDGTGKSITVPGADAPGDASPSGRWVVYRNTDLGDQGDYIYSAMFLYDTTTRTHHAITPAGPQPVDLAKLKGSTDLPPGTCKIPGEARTTWMPDRDVLILENCGDARFLIVRPEGRSEPLAAEAVAFYG